MTILRRIEKKRTCKNEKSGGKVGDPKRERERKKKEEKRKAGRRMHSKRQTRCLV